MNYYKVTDNELYHHGILGQKWGVRRYQNYDGTYTKRGLERYNVSKNEYEKKKSELDLVKKSDSSSKKEIRNAKNAVRKARKQMNGDYDKLKNAYDADKGKALYKSGQRITSNSVKTGLLNYGLLTIGTASFTAAKNEYASMGNPYVVNALSAIGGLAVGSAVVNSYVNRVKTEQMRAYLYR